jgi:septal ring factor EnvC (AmiA/AmiB activator)
VHVANANAYADSVIALGAQLLVPVDSIEITGLSEAAASYRAGLIQTHQATTKEFEAFRTTIGDERERISRELEEAKTQLGDLKSTIDAERDRLSRTQIEQQEQFSSAQETRSTEFSNSLQVISLLRIGPL